jgi:hypothetical protein
MPVTDMQIAVLRAFLTHEGDRMATLAYQLGEAGMLGYVRLAEAALSVTAQKKFAPRFTSADLVKFIAAVRTARLSDGDEFDFDPVVGEYVLRCSLGQPVMRAPGLEPRLRTVVALLDALAEEELTSEADLDSLLAEARLLADRWQITADARRLQEARMRELEEGPGSF